MDVGDPRQLGLEECVRRLVLRAAGPPEVDGAGCLLMDGEGALRFVSASDAPGQVLEVAEELAVEGPCHEAFLWGDTVVDDIRSDPRYTRLRALLADSPVRTVMGVPVLLEGAPIGSLNAFTFHPRSWSEADFAALRACAAQLGEVLGRGLDAQLDRSGDVLAVRTRKALQHRDLLGQAAAVVTAGTGLPTTVAALRLRQLAAVTGTSAVAVAQRVLERGRLPALGEVSDWVAAERRHRQEMTRLALTDPLTGLANRMLFLDRLDQALLRADRSAHGPAVLFIDLDRFKVINDSMGHEVGDQVLCAVAQRVRLAVRPEDTVGRLGGDEFAVLCEEAGDAAAAAAVAHRVAEAIEAPVTVAVPTREGVVGQQVSISASIGITLPDGDQPLRRATEALRDADMAMYAAKQTGGGRVELFTVPLRDAGHRSMSLELALRAALESNRRDAPQAAPSLPAGFSLAYQPLIQVATGTVAAVEALVRWRHEDLGPVAPEVLIALAEEVGLIGSLGAAVLAQACRDAQIWRTELGIADRDLIVAVNVSAQQLALPGFPDSVQAALGASGLPHSSLCLEVTESELLEAAGTGLQALQQLSLDGVHLTLDDFGTGYSSLAYLTRLPVQQLKIDRSFIAGMDTNPDDRAVAEAVIGLARTLRLRTVAEGVETSAQERTLSQLGCELAQGYLYSRPISADDLLPLLASRGVMADPTP